MNPEVGRFLDLSGLRHIDDRTTCGDRLNWTALLHSCHELDIGVIEPSVLLSIIRNISPILLDERTAVEQEPSNVTALLMLVRGNNFHEERLAALKLLLAAERRRRERSQLPPLQGIAEAPSRRLLPPVLPPSWRTVW